MISINEYGRTPAVFVSSTCYDLKQIRSNIRNFIETDLGYEAILSEFDSFPLDPDISTIDNCIRVVKHRADIFCLIIGGRYGNITDSGKSITNLEYIHARAKGIPIYVFVSKDILAILPLWEKNKTADYSGVVDNSQLFEFVSELRGKENIWTYGFDNAEDIINTLRKQFGYLFYDALKIREKINSINVPLSQRMLDGKALKIISEKPKAWEYILLGEVLEQSIKQYSDIKRDLVYGFSFGNSIIINNINDLIDFLLSKVNYIGKIVANINILFETVLPDALGPPGKPGDVEKIIFAGQKFGFIYNELLKWGLEFKLLSVDDEWMSLVTATSKMWESPIADIDQYMDKYKHGINEIVSYLNEYAGKESLMPEKNIDLVLTVKSPVLDEFYIEIDKLRNQMGIIDYGEY